MTRENSNHNMLSGITRNEEEDRKIAALAITELSEVKHKHEGNACNAFQSIKATDDYAGMIICENSTPNEPLPLDLTYKNRVIDNEILQSQNKLCKGEKYPYPVIQDHMLKFDISQNISDSVGKHYLAENIPNSIPPTPSPATFTFLCEHPQKLGSIFQKSENLTAIQNFQTSLVRKNDKESNYTTNNNNNIMPKNANELSEHLLKSPPTGLDSLANFYANCCRKNQKRMKKKHFLKDGKISHGVCKKSSQLSYNGNTKVTQIPSGLSSINEFYRNTSTSKLELPKESLETFCPSKIPLPLCIEDAMVSNVKKCRKTDEKKSQKKSSKSARRKLHKDKEPLESINIESPVSQNSAELIPLKVLEMSLTDDNQSQAINKNNSSCASHKNSKKDKNNKSLKTKERTSDDKSSEIKYDFLNPDSDGDFILHIVASREDSEMMKRFLPLVKEQGGDICCRDAYRQTPLHISVVTKNMDIVCSLLEAGASPCHTDLKGQTCIHLAVLHNNMAALKLMLEHANKSNFNCNVVDFEGRTALHLATLKGNKEAIDVLINSGSIDINAREGKSGKTALYLSVERDMSDIFSMLLRRGASYKESDYSGYMPYQVALTRQNYDIMCILDEHQKKTNQ